jgi:H+/Cl- antiporter ClcA
MQQLLPHYAHHIMPGVWALIGAAATLAGVTRTTGPWAALLTLPEVVAEILFRDLTQSAWSLSYSN